MNITIKATLSTSSFVNILYYDIKYKIGNSLFYKECDNLHIVNEFDFNDSVFKKKCIEKLSELDEEEVKNMIVNKLINYLQKKKKEDHEESEYESLVKKFGSLKFKVNI